MFMGDIMDIVNDKIVIIYGQLEVNGKDMDGKIEMLESGYEENHIDVFIDYIENNMKNDPFMKQVNSKFSPNTIACMMSLEGHIVFFNTTSYNKNNQNNIKDGLLVLPIDISEKQKESLYFFIENIDNYRLLIQYDITLNEGIFDSKQIQMKYDDTPKELLDQYFSNNNKTK